MNRLSWFIYLAETIPQLGVILYVLGFSTLVLYGLVTLCYALEKEKFHGVWWPLAIFPVTLFLVALIPSTQTIYLIAGSEAAEVIVTSPEGQEIINDVQQVIRAQLNKLKE